MNWTDFVFGLEIEELIRNSELVLFIPTATATEHRVLRLEFHKGTRVLSWQEGTPAHNIPPTGLRMSSPESGKICFVNRRFYKRFRRTQSPLTHLCSQNPSDNQNLEDRISTLPDHILHHILSFLPMELSVQTSILSKRWRHLWKYNPVVDFYFSGSCGKTIDNDAITRCLYDHKAPKITKFGMVNFVSQSKLNLRQWVSFALLKQVEVLKVGLVEFGCTFFVLPDLLYEKDKTHSLEKLYLSSVDFCPHPRLAFSGFSSLKVLSLTYCKVSDETLEVLLSKCLALEALTIDCCEGLVNVKISGQKLKEFVFRFGGLRGLASFYGQGVTLEVVDARGLELLKYSGDLTKIHLKNLPDLAHVTLISNYEEINETNIGSLRTLVNEVAQVFALGVNSWFLQFMAKEHQMRDSSCTTFQNLGHFVWYGQLMSECDVFNLVAFLGNCPSLRTVKIDFRKNFWDGFCGIVFECFKEPEFVRTEDGQEKVHAACLERLKFVEVLSFSGFKGEMELVKKLLEKAVALETMLIYWRLPPSVMSDNELQVLYRLDSEIEQEIQKKLFEEQISLFPKASSHSQVLFK